MRMPLAIIALLCSASPQAESLHSALKNRPQYYEDSAGYKLLSAVLENENKDSWRLKSLDISKQSMKPNGLSLCKQLPAEFRTAADDLSSKSPNVMQFRRRFSLKLPYSLTYGGGATDIVISVVGFDAAKDHAVVTVFKGCGSMCSSGSTYLFRKVEAEWQRVGIVCETMS